MGDEIVKYTNIYIERKQDVFSRIRDAKETTKEDTLARLVLLYFIGIKKENHTDFREIWDVDEEYIISRACVSSRRYLFLLSAMRFDDINTTQERKLTDKLAAIRTSR
ncbi:Transposase IS4 [Popillia japonica]|uniref:Transposase IS4 n=1 Tax=Popillia japonica TaxID=7064 RepID=A0AAW1M1F5_POPJA